MPIKYAITYFLFKPADGSVLNPIAIYPLNGDCTTKEIKNRQPQGVAKDVSLAYGPDGMPNGSYQFFGNTTSYIQFPNNGSLDVQHSITMLCWVYYSKASTYGPLFAYNNCFRRKCVAFYIKHKQLVACFAGKELTTELALNVWHYIGVTYDYATDNASLWVNGTKREQTSFNPRMILATKEDVRMGSKKRNIQSVQNFNFEGRIAVMQVYNFALTQAQIEAVKYVAAGRGKNVNFRNTVPFLFENTGRQGFVFATA